MREIVLRDGDVYKWDAQSNGVCILVQLRNHNWGLYNTQWNSFFADVGNTTADQMKQTLSQDGWTYVCRIREIFNF